MTEEVIHVRVIVVKSEGKKTLAVAIKCPRAISVMNKREFISATHWGIGR